MYILQSFHAIDIWGYKKVNLDFNRDITILIGENGVGKTTILQLISSLLLGDCSILRRVNFRKMTLVLCHSENVSEHYSISVSKAPDEKTGGTSLVFETDREDVKMRKLRLDQSSDARLLSIYLNAIYENKVHISWLPIDRDSKVKHSVILPVPAKANIDERLRYLNVLLKDYFSQLERESLGKLESLKNAILDLFLFDNAIDANDQFDRVSSLMFRFLLQKTIVYFPKC